MKKQPFQKQLGKHLKKIRVGRGISLRELEQRREGIDRATLSEIENGLTNPTMFTMRKICDGLGISFSEFFKEYTK